MVTMNWLKWQRLSSGEEARVGAVEPMMRKANSEGVPPAYADQPSSSRTNTSTSTRKRPTVGDPLEESLHAKVTRPSDFAQSELDDIHDLFAEDTKCVKELESMILRS